MMMSSWMSHFVVGVRSAVSFAVTVAFACAPARAGVSGADALIDREFPWAVIGDPGNPSAPSSLFPFQPGGPARGGVNYEYRISKTEVTVGQWARFVSAYLPYYKGNAINPGFHGNGILYVGPFTGYQVRWDLNAPTTMNWQYAARYCNWLHNGMATNQEAFELGVYDMSTLVIDPITGRGQMNTTPMPGARVWIPTLDEWTKAAYYDPDRHGPGQGGYWMYPNSSDTQSVAGLPSEGGQTSRGSLMQMPVGSYPGTVSPWGLLDVSGGVAEILNYFPESTYRAWAVGTDYMTDNILAGRDSLGWSDHNFVGFTGGGSLNGLRLAAPIPGTGVPVTILASLSLLSRRSRSCSNGLAYSTSQR